MTKIEDQARSVFLAALTRPPEQWPTFLNEACGEDAELRERAEQLLRAHQAQGSIHPGPPASDATTDEVAVRERPGAVIGRYKLLEQIGEGGFGVVFMAEQQEPVRRKVALKVIKPGMDTRQVVARFEAERQALALMDHPNIAKVHDGGATSTGRPYFVMELVKGVPITDFCDQNRLTPRERMGLFLSVCQAVQHAHQKGIIHRDLKPSNVLVTMHDTTPVVKVIDFGVAKAMGQELTDKTLFTGFGQMVGTPLYMSPEQAGQSGLDVDTRSDIYSLGVLLYELLTGTTPFTKDHFKKAGFDEIRRILQEEEPPKPSTRLSESKEALPTVSARRQTEAAKLTKLVRGELDWIVMRCLEKDRNRRYETANGLAKDLERYLADEPVQAGPPSAAYRLRKFARRHRAGVAIAGAALGVLLLAVVGLALSTAMIWQAKNEAVRAFESEESSSYRQRIALAEREWSANNQLRVQQLLDQCPPKHRGWEWRYLKRLPGKALEPLRHEHAVRRMTVSPDGRLILTGDTGGVLTIWDAATGEQLRRFPGHAGGVNGLAFSPNSECFATSGRDLAGKGQSVLKVWQTRTGKELTSWEIRHARASEPKFLSDDVLTLRNDNEAGHKVTLFFDPMTGKELSTLGDPARPFTRLPINPDNELLVGPGGKVWDVRTGEHVRTLEGGGGEGLYSSTLSPDGRSLALCFSMPELKGHRKLLVWDVRTGKQRLVLEDVGVTCMAFHPDGTRLATDGPNNTVRILDAATGQEILSLMGHYAEMRGLAFTPDGHRLVSCSDDKTVIVWDARPLRKGEKIGQELFTLEGHTDSVTAVAFHPKEPLLATASTDGLVKLWDPRTGKEARPFSMRSIKMDKVETLAFSPDGQRLAVAGQKPMTAAILDAATGEVIRKLNWPEGRRGGWMRKVVFSPDGKTLALAANGGAAFLYDATTGAEVVELPGHFRLVNDVAFHPDAGKPLVVTTDSIRFTIRVWATKPAPREVKLLHHQGYTEGVAFSPNGRLLATGGSDRLLRLWDTATWKEVDRMSDLTGSIDCLAFHPKDDRIIAWGASDSTVKVWQRESREVVTLRGHTDEILGIAFSPDGTRIASAGNDGTARVWETPKLR